MILRLFISSVQKELVEERAAFRDYLRGDVLLRRLALVPANPLLAEPMYLTKYIERMGTGIRNMIQRCAAGRRLSIGGFMIFEESDR